LLIALLEPDSLANLVTNMAVSKCANAHDAYLECTNYAITQLNLDNVAMYLDAGKFHLGNIYLGCENILWEIFPEAVFLLN
jgi:cellulase/cellobiase CelA1